MYLAAMFIMASIFSINLFYKIMHINGRFYCDGRNVLWSLKLERIKIENNFLSNRKVPTIYVRRMISSQSD